MSKRKQRIPRLDADCILNFRIDPEPNHHIKPTLAALRALKLWNPEAHWADHPTAAFHGTLAEAIARARAWLRRYLGAEADAVDVVIDVDAFPTGPLGPALRRKPRGASR